MDWLTIILALVVGAALFGAGYVAAWMRDGYHCPHDSLTGIYGDAIHTHNGRRLICNDCGRCLDGPVRLARERGEARP